MLVRANGDRELMRDLFLGHSLFVTQFSELNAEFTHLQSPPVRTRMFVRISATYCTRIIVRVKGLKEISLWHRLAND